MGENKNGSVKFWCSYVWAAAGKQPELEKHVGVGGYGYPALIALNIKKAVYAPLRSAFERDQIMYVFLCLALSSYPTLIGCKMAGWVMVQNRKWVGLA